MSHTVISALIGFGVGFGVGVVVAPMFREAVALLRGRVSLPKASPNDRSVTMLLATLAVLQIGLAGWVAYQEAERQQGDRDFAEFTACTARWQQSFAASYSARLKPAVKVQSAIDEIVAAAASPDRDIALAVGRYQELRTQQVVDRAKNPLPPLPEDVCGRAPR